MQTARLGWVAVSAAEGGAALGRGMGKSSIAELRLDSTCLTSKGFEAIVACWIGPGARTLHKLHVWGELQEKINPGAVRTLVGAANAGSVLLRLNTEGVELGHEGVEMLATNERGRAIDAIGL